VSLTLAPGQKVMSDMAVIGVIADFIRSLSSLNNFVVTGSEHVDDYFNDGIDIDPALEAIGIAVSELQTVKKLSIQGYPIQRKGIGAFLRKSMAATSMTVNGDCISLKAAGDFGVALSTLKQLHELRLLYLLNTSNQSIDMIISGLASTQTLEKLTVVASLGAMDDSTV
jgi:hypothetical protein